MHATQPMAGTLTITLHGADPEVLSDHQITKEARV